MNPSGFSVSVEKFASLLEMRERLQISNTPCFELGEDADAPRDFFCFTVSKPESPVARIGILSFGVGTEPNWLIKDGKILIGYNDRIAIFGLEKFSLERETNLSSLFYKFIVFEQFEHICVLCETAIVGMSSNGLEIWRVDTDLITDFAISGNSIRLEFSDSPVVEINLYTGKTN